MDTAIIKLCMTFKTAVINTTTVAVLLLCRLTAHISMTDLKLLIWGT